MQTFSTPRWIPKYVLTYDARTSVVTRSTQKRIVEVNDTFPFSLDGLSYLFTGGDSFFLFSRLGVQTITLCPAGPTSGCGSEVGGVSFHTFSGAGGGRKIAR